MCQYHYCATVEVWCFPTRPSIVFLQCSLKVGGTPSQGIACPQSNEGMQVSGGFTEWFVHDVTQQGAQSGSEPRNLPSSFVFPMPQSWKVEVVREAGLTFQSPSTINRFLSPMDSTLPVSFEWVLPAVNILRSPLFPRLLQQFWKLLDLSQPTPGHASPGYKAASLRTWGIYLQGSHSPFVIISHDYPPPPHVSWVSAGSCLLYLLQYSQPLSTKS